MPRTRLLMLLGLTPFLIGFVLNAAFLTVLQAHFQLLSAVLLGLWGYLSYRLRNPQDSALKNAMLLQVPAFAVLLLVIYQAYLRGEFWPNAFGRLTQFYYLPVIPLAAQIARLFFDAVGSWQLYTLGFALMFVASLVGGAMSRDV
ncbi:MAG: hypothetical protein KGZ64_01960 [Thermaerobacter sp.]|nr:hypothetical protein [Thermaerobacter sp.]